MRRNSIKVIYAICIENESSGISLGCKTAQVQCYEYEYDILITNLGHISQVWMYTCTGF